MPNSPEDTRVNRQGLVTRTRGNVDRTITSLLGTSQVLAPSPSNVRKRLIIKNGASPIGINISGNTAAIGGAGTITLQAYEGIAFTDADCPQGVITVIGTAANYVTCYEGL